MKTSPAKHPPNSKFLQKIVPETRPGIYLSSEMKKAEVYSVYDSRWSCRQPTIVVNEQSRILDRRKTTFLIEIQSPTREEAKNPDYMKTKLCMDKNNNSFKETSGTQCWGVCSMIRKPMRPQNLREQ